ncbi:MAG: Rrf2 family transcriptional regulator [Planctomycetes bacterium]|nr:Rrf2 family transcriptional regulator [Planctomycetota bacterium]
MLRISKKADYAVFLLGAIAREGAYPGGPAADTVVSAHEIARRAGLNKSVVANLLKDFAKHGVLDSVRGLKGGYRLVKAPRDVSLHDILEVVEGKFTLVECIAHRGEAAGDDCGDDNDDHDSAPGGLLALANASAPAAAATNGEAEQGCSLYSFCPSKRPMHVVHERMTRLFREIRLDELCSLTPAADLAAVKSTTR